MAKALSNKTIFYGPHECDVCGKTICKVSKDQGGEEYDYPTGIIYPNTEWKKHSCGDLKDVIRDLRKKIKEVEGKDPWIKIIEKEIWPTYPQQKWPFPSQPVYPIWMNKISNGTSDNIMLCGNDSTTGLGTLDASNNG